MEQKLILEEWLKRKLTFNSYWYLKEPITVEYEFKGGRMGHPSNYAFVRFEVNSAVSLSFQSTDLLINSYYESSICEAIVDALVCSTLTTRYIGCSLNLIDIKEDEVSSSEVAFYKATKGALLELIRLGKWGLSQNKT